MNWPSQVFRLREVPKRNSLSQESREPLRVGVVPLIVCVLFLWLPVSGQEMAPVPKTIVVRSCGKTSPTLAYAVQRIVVELRTVHGLQSGGDEAAVDPFKSTAEDTGVVALGRPSESAPLAKWCRDRSLDLASLASRPDGYHIVAQVKPWRIVIVADTDLGAWYGACAWMDSLRDAADGAVSTPLGEVDDAPALAIRFSRGLGASEHLSRPGEAIPSLDWWARWRMNVAHVGQLPEPALDTFLPEAHKRGIRAVRALGVRNLCAADDLAVARCAEEFKSFLQLGGDGASALWDDLPHDRCRGHCDRCRERFGTNSLPHEIVRILEALCDVAAQSPGQPLILWCPPHYSEDRYPELSDEAFFRVIGASRKIRQQTQMYYCEFAPEKLAILDQAGITNRVWWYNGLRTVYHVSHNWPCQPEMKLTIPGLKSFDVPDFARFEVGWKTGIGVRGDGTVLPVPDKAWQDLRTLPARYQGYYPCTAGHPYHAAISGLFAFSPRQFEQPEADRVVFRAIFGPGCAEAARAWSDAYVQLQVWLAQTAGSPNSEAQVADSQRRLARWRALSREVQACAGQGHSLLSPAILESTLSRMREAEDAAEKILIQRNRSAQQQDHELAKHAKRRQSRIPKASTPCAARAG
jgi:hypothetical protein